MARNSRRTVKAMLESKPVRFGIVGCGSASIPVCEAIMASPLTDLTAVYDVNEDLANDISQRFHVQKMGTVNELLTDQLVDAVYIAVPHYLLAPLTQHALEAGKHSLTEKPLAISLEEVDQLIKLAIKQQLALGVFYEMRYAPAHASARELIQAGAIGNIIGVQIQTLIDKPLSYWQAGYTGRSRNPWRGIKAQAGGGVVLMNTSHLLDALAYVTGLMVTSVSAEIGTLVSSVEVEDTATATLRFNNGAIGSLIAGAHINGAHQEEYFNLYGTEGQLRLPDPYGSDPLRIYLRRAWGDFPAEQWHSIPTESVSVYQRAIEDFVQAVQSKGCVPIDAKAARQVLAVVLGIYQSAAEKRTISIS
ncbi:MAG: Gfo/Idh/MocA family oxidoreductase [Anaerolineae bacterium]|nr:Gfo/Idh/MocA family oxidoreductase [Anaerolineae bacterium]